MVFMTCYFARLALQIENDPPKRVILLGRGRAKPLLIETIDEHAYEKKCYPSLALLTLQRLPCKRAVYKDDGWMQIS